MTERVSPVQGFLHPSMKDVDVETRSVEPAFFPQPYPTGSPYNTTLPRQQSYEAEPEIALDSGPPIIEIFVHIIAVGAIGVLAWANYTGQFYDDFSLESTSWQNMQIKLWQLGAKLHELFMLASLSFIVAYYTRKLLIGRKGIPFGLLHGSGVIGSPEVLIKRPFRAGFRRNWAFGALLIIVSVISLILGPSSAIMVIPSLGWFDLPDRFPGDNSTMYYITSNDTLELWPAAFNSTIPFDGSDDDNKCLKDPGSLVNIECPTAGHVDIGKWFISYITSNTTNGPVIADGYGNTKRQMSAGFSHGPQNGKDPTTKPPTHGYATVMTQLTSITLGSFWTYALDKKIGDVQDLPVPRLRIDHDTLVKQPIVLVSCEVSTRYNDSDAHGVTFPAVESQWQDDSAYQQSMFSIDENDDFLKKLPNDKTNFNWFKDPRPGFNSTASLYAVLIVPFNSTNATSNFTTQASAITACSIDARWATSDVWYEPTNSTFVNSNVSIGLFQDINAGYDPSFRSQYGLSEMPVDLKVDWAEFLDEEQESKNTSMVELLELPVTHYDDTGISTFRVPGVDGSNFDGAFEAAISMLLSVVVADGMARSASYGRQPYYATWSNKTQVDYTPLPLYRLPGSFTPQTFNKTFEAHLKANGTLHKISVDVDHYGYGYLMQNTTSRWAMICLFVYALGVCIHVLYILAALCFGRYVGGKCWNNVGDLVALAMNSSPTARLHGTSAGVKEKEIWKDVVKVRETGGKHLELCFVQGRDEEMGAIVGGKKEKSYH